MATKKQAKDKARPQPLKAKAVSGRKAAQVKGGRAPGGGGGTQCEDEIYVGSR
jgi:hypothetical protein